MPEDDDTKVEDKKEKLYTEEELQRRLNQVGSSEKKDGKRTREAEILEELGVKDLDEAKRLLTNSREEEEKRKSELEKLQEAAQRERDAAEADRRQAQRDRIDANIERALLAAGLTFPADAKQEEKDKIINRARRSLELDMDGKDLPDADTIAKAVEDLKSDVPSFFEVQEKKEPPKPVHGDAGKPPGQVPPADEAAAAAQEQLHRLHPELKKTTTGS